MNPPGWRLRAPSRARGRRARGRPPAARLQRSSCIRSPSRSRATRSCPARRARPTRPASSSRTPARHVLPVLCCPPPRPHLPHTRRGDPGCSAARRSRACRDAARQGGLEPRSTLSGCREVQRRERLPPPGPVSRQCRPVAAGQIPNKRLAAPPPARCAGYFSCAGGRRAPAAAFPTRARGSEAGARADVRARTAGASTSLTPLLPS
jgi:hypothetical protein